MQQRLANAPKDVLLALEKAGKLSHDGKEWLTLALDPYHDYEHQVAGYPDADASQTTVSCYQYQKVISAPPNAPANWDAHVYTLPVCYPDGTSLFTLSADWKTMQEPNPAVQNWVQGPLNIVTNLAGGELGISTSTINAPTKTTLPAAGVEDLCSGITRVIGMGFEITNTTSELNKQGTLTVYRMPQLGNTYQMKTISNGTLVAPVVGEMWRLPPRTVADANLLKGTKTWAASDGVYCTCLQNSVHNPLRMMESQQLMYGSEVDPGVASLVMATQYDAMGAAATAPNASCVAFPPNQTMPFDTTGVFLTGLSNSTTLSITMKVYVERAPTWKDANLAVLATPSAGYDVRALELYAMVANRLPPGVKVDQNALGDWWRAVTGIIKTVSPSIGLALNPLLPGAAAIGQGVARLTGVVDSSVTKITNAVKAIKPKQKQKAKGK